MNRIGFIGGSGLYDIPQMKVDEERLVETPWGLPSDHVILGTIENVPVAFLARHGRGHKITPTEVNSRANIAALKTVGADVVVAFSAVGSLREEIAPLDFVVPTQIIDRTRLRPNTFFGEGIVGHVPFAEPFCTRLEKIVSDSLESLSITTHRGKTLVVMEGPAFSTKAESHLYRSWGADIINMSALPEAKLAREAEMCYQMVCMSTDYDCWHEEEESVTVEMVIERLTKNADNARRAVVDLVKKVSDERHCACSQMGRTSVITAEGHWPQEAGENLKALWRI